MMPKAMVSSEEEVWSTPHDFFDPLDREFGFTLDVCALETNAKCERYFSPESDGLSQGWGAEVCWMNPPYGRTIGKWMRKALSESRLGATVVCLVPARVDARWWHDCCLGAEIRFPQGRLRYKPNDENGPIYSAPFPSAVVVFRPSRNGEGVTVWGRKCHACGLAHVWRRNARYCSNACRQRAYRKRHA